MGRRRSTLLTRLALILIPAAATFLLLRHGGPREDGPIPSGPARPGAPGPATPRLVLRAAPAPAPAPVAVAPGPGPGGPVVSGSVHAADGTPVPGALLDVLPGAGPAPAVSDAGGEFRLLLPPPGSEAAVRVRAAGFLERRLSLSGRPAAPLRIVLEPGATVSGTVLDASGQPVPGARVEWLPEGGAGAAAVPTQRAEAERATRATLCDSLGAFRLAGLPPEATTLLATAPGHARSSRRRVQPPQEHVELRLRPGVALTGTVRDPQGRPVPQAWIVSEEPSAGDPDVQGHADAQGRFVFEGLPPVRRALGVTAPGHARFLREDVRFGGPPLEITLEPEAELRLVVRDAAGAAVPAEVRVLAPDGAYVWHDRRDERETIVLTGLGSGPYTVLVEPLVASERGARQRLDGVRTGGPALEVVLRPGLWIAGVLPLENAGEYVYVVPHVPGPRPPLRHPLRAAARPAQVEVGSRAFRIDGLGEGLYDVLVVVSDADRRDGEVPPGFAGALVRAVPAGTSDLVLALPTPEPVVGEVTTPAGAPLPFLQVQAYDEHGLCRASTRRGGADGRFSLGGLPQGRYRLVAWLEDGSLLEDEVVAPARDLRLGRR